MNKIKVIFRKDRKDKSIVAFFPEFPARYGNIACYENTSHGETSYNYYNDTMSAKKEEYSRLLEQLKQIYCDYDLIVKKKLHYPDLLNVWKKSVEK